ncbi:MAG TPA: D-alanyl-D-alanine carboxypeptidase [Thermoanaerobaculia bacterium]|nr:D-alanyl-D-alanine carboxypeptidase [Thermoanaerobaculia bacterium]
MELRVKYVLCLLLFAGCATTRPNAIDRTIATKPLDHAIWAILVEDDDGKVVYSRNAGTMMIPASNRKLFAAATVVNCLGADTRLATRLYLDDNDVVLAGDGDPSLGSARYERDREFDGVAELLRARGVASVRDVIADVSRFDRVRVPGGWKVGNLTSNYAAPVDAIAWNENAIGDDAVPDPALFAAGALRDALVARGIAVTGTPRVVTEPHEWRGHIATFESPFIAHLLTTMLKNSHNLYAEMLFKRAAGGTYDFSVEQRAVGEMGLFRFVDGSGLAPDDLVTPEAVVNLLRWMNEPSRRGFWWAVLAQPNGEGTLRRRLVTLEQRMRGKTGTINGVAALSGIIAMPRGRYRYFSIIVNHHLADDATKAIDAIVSEIAQ